MAPFLATALLADELQEDVNTCMELYGTQDTQEKSISEEQLEFVKLRNTIVKMKNTDRFKTMADQE